MSENGWIIIGLIILSATSLVLGGEVAEKILTLCIGGVLGFVSKK